MSPVNLMRMKSPSILLRSAGTVNRAFVILSLPAHAGEAKDLNRSIIAAQNRNRLLTHQGRA